MRQILKPINTGEDVSSVTTESDSCFCCNHSNTSIFVKNLQTGKGKSSIKRFQNNNEIKNNTNEKRKENQCVRLYPCFCWIQTEFKNYNQNDSDEISKPQLSSTIIKNDEINDQSIINNTNNNQLCPSQSKSSVLSLASETIPLKYLHNYVQHNNKWIQLLWSSLLIIILRSIKKKFITNFQKFFSLPLLNLSSISLFHFIKWQPKKQQGQSCPIISWIPRILGHFGSFSGFRSTIQLKTMITILLLIILCYHNSLMGDFVHDDIPAIVQNPDVLGTTSISQLFQNDFWGRKMSDPESHKSYRPITILTFRLNMMISVHPYGFHLVNLFLHIAVTFLFCCLTRMVFQFEWRHTLIAGCLFATHPIHCEAVSSIVGRADVLCAFFYLIAFLLFHLSLQTWSITRQWSILVLFVLATIMALLSKEIGITILGCCAFYWWWSWKSSIIQKSNNKIIIFSPMATVILSFCILIPFRLSLNQNNNPEFLDSESWLMPLFTRQDNPASYSNSVWTRILTFFYLAVFNLKLLLSPIYQSYDWQTSSISLIESFWDPRNLSTAFLIITSFTWIWQLRFHFGFKSKCPKNNEQLSEILSLLLLILPYLPASNLFITVGFVIAERLLYIPSIGFICLICIGLKRLQNQSLKTVTSINRFSKQRFLQIFNQVCHWFVILLIIVFAIKTIRQNRVWNCRESLYKSGIVNVPNNAKAHYNYGNLQQDIGNWNDAIYHYQTAIRLWPEHASAHNNLGTLYWKYGQPYEAEKHFQQALKINPYHAKAHFNLGKVFSKRGQTSEAIRLMERSIRLDPSFGESYESMATLLTLQGHELLAERFYRKAIRLRPRNADFHNNYGAFLQKTGRLEYARRYYRQALKLRPHHRIALVNMARLLVRLRYFSQAEYFYKKAMALRQDSTTMDSLGILYLQRSKLLKARNLYQRLLEKTAKATKSTSFFTGTPTKKIIGKTNNEDKFNVNNLSNSPLVNIHYAQLLILEGRFHDAEVLLEALTTGFVNNNNNNNDAGDVVVDDNDSRRRKSSNIQNVYNAGGGNNNQNNCEENDSSNLSTTTTANSNSIILMKKRNSCRKDSKVGNQIQHHWKLLNNNKNDRNNRKRLLSLSFFNSKTNNNNNNNDNNNLTTKKMDGQFQILAPFPENNEKKEKNGLSTINTSNKTNIKTKSTTNQNQQDHRKDSSSSSSIRWNISFQIDVYHQLALLHTLTNRSIEALDSISKALKSCQYSSTNEVSTKTRMKSTTTQMMMDLMIGSRCAQIYTLQGDIQKDLHQWSEAIQSYKQALILDECLPRAHLHLAVCYHLMDQYGPAMLHYNMALQLDSIGTNRLLIKENLAKLRFRIQRMMIDQHPNELKKSEKRQDNANENNRNNLRHYCRSRPSITTMVMDHHHSPDLPGNFQEDLTFSSTIASTGLNNHHQSSVTRIPQNELFNLGTNSNVVSLSSSLLSSY